MQQRHSRLGPSAGPFNAQTAQELILSRFGGAIGVPATRSVVANTADPGAQAGEVKRGLPLKQGFNGFRQKNGPDGVDGELLE